MEMSKTFYPEINLGVVSFAVESRNDRAHFYCVEKRDRIKMHFFILNEKISELTCVRDA